MAQPIVVLTANTKRESGRKVQIGNIQAGKAVADVIRTCLGPRAMLKMLMDPTGGIVMTNDGNAILREITVEHPAAKSLIEIARAQDEEVGDGTTSVIVLTGELLAQVAPFIEQQIHPTIVIQALRMALDDALEALKRIALPIDTNNRAEMATIVSSALGTKLVSKWGDFACNMALDAVSRVTVDQADGRKEIDIKRYAKVEKVPGGTIEDCKVLDGVMINKDVTHPKMRRRIENPRVILLDGSLEYKKGESQTNMELSKDTDLSRALQIEEEYIRDCCEDIIRLKPDLVITEKGVSDLASHFLLKANITCVRRVRKTDNNRLARVCGATIASRTDEVKEADVGTKATLFEVKLVGEEYFMFLTGANDAKACTVLLRGASKDVLNEVERNLQDAMSVARNMLLEPRLLPGGGAVELAVAQILNDKAKTITGVHQRPYRAVARALEVIPRTLIQNCGASVIRTLTALRAKHASGQADASYWGVNGESGEQTDMRTIRIVEPFAVKAQTYKTAVETAILLLRIDDIVSGIKKKREAPAAGGAKANEDAGGEKQAGEAD